MATAAAANESRSDLLSWINDLLQLNVTKIESVGMGAVYCQIMDSIYGMDSGVMVDCIIRLGDVQMHKVKFNTNQEYEYVNNFKVLQSCFTQHGIDKFIPVERLVKLKFQDNLEFLQWMKKFWDGNYPGGSYDPISRRRGQPSLSAEPLPMQKSSSGIRTMLANPSELLVKSGAARQPASMATISTAQRQRISTNDSDHPQTPSSVGQLQHQVSLLNRTITELRVTLDDMEKERDFYFHKLREIEIATQQVTEPTILNSGLFKNITELLYKTEDGFEIPTDNALACQ